MPRSIIRTLVYDAYNQRITSSSFQDNHLFISSLYTHAAVSSGSAQEADGISSSAATPMLQIVEMRVPLVVEDGSASSVVLDCDYSLRSPEKRSELVVQWYFQNGSSPVYQWIPGKRPQDLGILKGRLNLDYRASNDPFKRHRALEILQPTFELSGVYRCKVATVEEEAIMAKTMIVYSKLTCAWLLWMKRITFGALKSLSV